jgi:hypothetical protein
VHYNLTANKLLSLFLRCETCGKGFLRRERYVTHVRIHTGEKPFVCAVCARGYRDKRELRKHQASHNLTGQGPAIPGNQQIAVASGPAPVSIPVSAGGGGGGHLQAAHIVNDALSPSNKTIIVQQTVSLPSQPLPKEVLNMNGNANTVQIIQQAAPLNPATIPLPPSVATALQSINEKVAAKQAKQAKQAIQNLSTQPAPPPPQQTFTIAKQEAQAPPQVVAIPQGAVAASGGASNANGPLFYYVMPGNVPYNIASEGGTTVRVTTEGGNVSTAQLVSVPASAIQGIQQQVSNGSSSFPASWIIETSPGGGANTRGGSSGNAM